jgi:hypothetical protein
MVHREGVSGRPVRSSQHHSPKIRWTRRRTSQTVDCPRWQCQATSPKPRLSKESGEFINAVASQRVVEMQRPESSCDEREQKQQQSLKQTETKAGWDAVTDRMGRECVPQSGVVKTGRYERDLSRGATDCFCFTEATFPLPQRCSRQSRAYEQQAGAKVRP